MKSRCLFALAVCLYGASSEPYKFALPGYHYEFPRDHFNHPEYQTEWWYYTGNLHTSEGRHFGFELTFFRQGVDRDTRQNGVWDVHDVWMAHLALSDINGGKFQHTERLNRSGAGLAGADLREARVWNGNWQASWRADQSQELRAVADRFSFQLALRSEKPPVIHGAGGVSQKAEGAGHASHYISMTRLMTDGNLVVDGKQFKVDGLSWMDHEFFTQQLDAGQVGWDWFSLQLEDGSDVMLFQIRRKDGTRDPYSAGTYVDRLGRASHLAEKDFSLVPGKTWTSPDSGGRYPVEWTVLIPSHAVDAGVSTRLPQQELISASGAVPPYWEGAIEIAGKVTGVGYLEMTGYTGKRPLQ